MNSPDKNSDSHNNVANNVVNVFPQTNLDNHEKNSRDDNNHSNGHALDNNNIPSSKEEKSFDIKNFISESEIKNTIHSISTSNDLAIIGECSEQHNNFKGIINKRINNLKMLLGFCNQNNLVLALNAINIMKDQTVTNDFFHFYINKNDLQKVSLCLDNVLSLLPHINMQINSKYDVYQVCALKSAKLILENISERVISVKAMPNGTGVDLAREERIKKCDDIIVRFNEIKESLNLEKMRNSSNDELKKLVNEFVDLETFLVKNCKK